MSKRFPHNSTVISILFRLISNPPKASHYWLFLWGIHRWPEVICETLTLKWCYRNAGISLDLHKNNLLSLSLSLSPSLSLSHTQEYTHIQEYTHTHKNATQIWCSVSNKFMVWLTAVLQIYITAGYVSAKQLITVIRTIQWRNVTRPKTVGLRQMEIQWNLSVTTTSIINFITPDLFSNVFLWRLKVPIYSY